MAENGGHAAPKGTAYFVRHGESTSNDRNVFAGAQARRRVAREHDAGRGLVGREARMRAAAVNECTLARSHP
jgi:hypothetical protein